MRPIRARRSRFRNWSTLSGRVRPETIVSIIRPRLLSLASSGLNESPCAAARAARALVSFSPKILCSTMLATCARCFEIVFLSNYFICCFRRDGRAVEGA